MTFALSALLLAAIPSVLAAPAATSSAANRAPAPTAATCPAMPAAMLAWKLPAQANVDDACVAADTETCSKDETMTLKCDQGTHKWAKDQACGQKDGYDEACRAYYPRCVDGVNYPGVVMCTGYKNGDLAKDLAISAGIVGYDPWAVPTGVVRHSAVSAVKPTSSAAH